MIDDLQPNEVVIAEKIDRISRLPLIEAERLVSTIRDRGARLAIPGIVDLSDLAHLIQCAPTARFTSGGRIHPGSCW